MMELSKMDMSLDEIILQEQKKKGILRTSRNDEEVKIDEEVPDESPRITMSAVDFLPHHSNFIPRRAPGLSQQQWVQFRNFGSCNFRRPGHSQEKEPVNNEDETTSNVAEPVKSSCTNAASQDNESHGTAVSGTSAFNQDGLSRGKKRKMENAGPPYCLWTRVCPNLKLAKDESNIFCELLCLKLRELEKDTRDLAMHEINNLMFHFKKTVPKSNIPCVSPMQTQSTSSTSSQ